MFLEYVIIRSKVAVAYVEDDEMDYPISEKRALKKLGIDDFRHLTKANVVQLASMVDKMEPEVAKKALEQFPEFSGTVKTILLDYKELLNRAIDSDNESLRSTYETYNSIIMALQTELDKDTLSFDERKYIIEQMKDIANAVDKKDSENKKWLTKMAMIAGVTVVGVAAVLGSVLGTNTNFQQIDTDNANTDDEND